MYDAVAERGFDVVDTTFWNPDQTLRAVTGVMSGSATGRVRHVFFFVDGQGLIGTDALDPSESLSFSWRTHDTIAVDYVLYRDGDAGCCPTGGTATVRFQWDGDRLNALDDIPPTTGPTYR